MKKSKIVVILYSYLLCSKTIVLVQLYGIYTTDLYGILCFHICKKKHIFSPDSVYMFLPARRPITPDSSDLVRLVLIDQRSGSFSIDL